MPSDKNRTAGVKRRLTRLFSLISLYNREITNDDSNYFAHIILHEQDWLKDILLNFALDKEQGDKLSNIDSILFMELVEGVTSNISLIDDDNLTRVLPTSWKIERLDIVLRNIMRLGIFELLFKKDIPAKIIISEYVNIAASFYNGKEIGFTNAVLQESAKVIRSSEFSSN